MNHFLRYTMDSTNKTSHDQMIAGNCECCEGLIRIPVNANPNATVMCPRCHESFCLGDVLNKIAPAVEFVDAPERKPIQIAEHDNKINFVPVIDIALPQPETRQRGDKFAVSPILSNGAKRKKRRRGSSSGVNSGFRTESASQNGTQAGANNQQSNSNSTEPSLLIAERIAESRSEKQASVGQPVTSRRRPATSYSTRSDSNGAELAKIVFGAMLAIPVAQMLIWWFAGTDPLGLGPKIGSFAPFVVPVEFRDEADSEFDKIFDKDVSSDDGKKELLVSEETPLSK